MIHDPFVVFVKQHIPYSLAVRIGLFHSLDPGSTPGMGTNAHNSVVECYTSNVDTRVRFPLGVNSLVLLSPRAGLNRHLKKNLVEDKVFPLIYRFSSVGSSVGLLAEDDSPMSRVRAPQSVS